MEPIVFLNGKLLPLNQAKVSVTDYGFLYGYGLFETMRAYDGKVFLLERHLTRLAGSAEKLGFCLEQADLKAAVGQTLDANGLRNARIRITASIGEGPLVVDPQSCRTPTVLVTATEYHPLAEATYRQGYRVIISSVRRSSRSPITGMKTTHYLDSLLARQEAKAAGADEAICLNEKGRLAEGSTSNVFIIKDGVLRTPALNSGILPGVTRGFILEIAAQLGIKTVETSLTAEQFLHADEVFLTNSIIEIMPVCEIDRGAVGKDVPGPVTTKLIAAYRRNVAAGQL